MQKILLFTYYIKLKGSIRFKQTPKLFLIREGVKEEVVGLKKCGTYRLFLLKNMSC